MAFLKDLALKVQSMSGYCLFAYVAGFRITFESVGAIGNRTLVLAKTAGIEKRKNTLCALRQLWYHLLQRRGGY